MKNERGITLMELLIAVSILLVITVVLFGALISTNKNYNNVSEDTHLHQEANIIVNTLKNHHQKQEFHTEDPILGASYVIHYDSEKKKAYIGKTDSSLIPLHNEKSHIIELIVNGSTLSGTMTIHPSDPLYISFNLMNIHGNSYIVDTVITKY